MILKISYLLLANEDENSTANIHQETLNMRMRKQSGEKLSQTLTHYFYVFLNQSSSNLHFKTGFLFSPNFFNRTFN